MDARVRYTKNMIKKTMISLLKMKPIEKITVKEICEICQINRATFYRYYDNPLDLFDKIEEDILDGLESRMDDNMQFRDIFTIIVDDICEKHEYYDLLFRLNDDGSFRKRVFNIAYGYNMKTVNTLFTDLDEHQREWLYYFIAEGSNGALQTWIRNGMKESGQEVVDFTCSMIENINTLLPGKIKV